MSLLVVVPVVPRNYLIFQEVLRNHSIFLRFLRNYQFLAISMKLGISKNLGTTQLKILPGPLWTVVSNCWDITSKISLSPTISGVELCPITLDQTFVPTQVTILYFKHMNIVMNLQEATSTFTNVRASWNWILPPPSS